MSLFDRLRTRRMPNRRRPPQAIAEPPHLIAISDLHLGADLRRGAKPKGPPPLDAPLAAFLRRFRRPHSDGHRWRLVIAGDMVDFIGMTALPRDGEQVTFTVSDDERSVGLNESPEKSAWKLARILERHRLVTRALASFLDAGNEIVIIRGNHDPDWRHEEVRRVFVTAMDREVRRGQRRRKSLTASIRFRDWFYFEPGRCFIEHGHLHDEYCTTGGADNGRPDAHQPISTLALRHFANRHDGLDMNAVDSWGWRDYLVWARPQGCFWPALGDYLRMCVTLIGSSVRTAAGSVRRRGQRLGASLSDELRLRQFSEVLSELRNAPGHLAEQWSQLWKAPAGARPHLVARLFFVDRAAALASAALTVLAVLWAYEGLLSRLCIAGAVCGVALWANDRLARLRLVDSHPKLLEAARHLTRLFDVPAVVMGHSHRPVEVPFGETRYINVGTWLCHGSVTEARAFPHFILDNAGPRLAQWRWTATRRGSAMQPRD